MINLTVLRLTMRALFGRRRFLLLLPLPAMVVGLAVLAEALGSPVDEWGEPVLVGLGFSVVLPVLALIVGASVLGSEIEDGTVVHTLAKPLPRSEIVISKLLVAAFVTTVTVGAGMLAAALVGGSTGLGIGLVAGTAVGACAYSAVFLALSLVTRRPVLFGLVYILIWETILGGLIDGIRVLSIQRYAVAVADRVADDPPMLPAVVSVPVSLTMAGILVVAATLLAVTRLRSFTMTGETS
jgi:ABC-2 type transport system permease protein